MSEDQVITILPKKVIEIDLSKSYKDNKAKLDRESIKYLEDVARNNRKVLNKELLYSLLELPRMTVVKMKKRLKL